MKVRVIYKGTYPVPSANWNKSTMPPLEKEALMDILAEIPGSNLQQCALSLIENGGLHSGERWVMPGCIVSIEEVK